MSVGTSRPVSGHGLRGEGIGYERVTWSGHERWLVASDQRAAVAICRCGEVSPPLPSTRARKQWHREHKAEVLAGRAEDTQGEQADG
jgi:hypothetical protein